MLLIDRYRRLSLRVKLAFWVTLGALAVVGLLTTLLLSILRQDVQRGVGDAQRALLDGVAQGLDEKIAARRQALALSADVMGGAIALTDLQRLHDHFITRPTLANLFDFIWIADANGTVTFDFPSTPGRTGHSIADREYFRQVMKTGATVVSDPVAGRTAHEPVVTFAAPVRDRFGTIVGVLGGVHHLARPNFLNAVGDLRIGKEGYFALLTRGAAPVYVAHAQRDRIMTPAPVHANPHLARALNQGFEGTVEGANSQGIETLRSYRSLRSVPWVLVAAYPTSEAYAGLHQRERQVVGLGVVLALVLGLLSWWFARRMLAPLNALEHAMNGRDAELIQDDVQIGASCHEITSLVRSFNRLMEHKRRVKGELAHSERRLRAITDNVPALVSYIDAGQRYRFTNAYYQVLFGIDPPSLIGRTVREGLGDAIYGTVQDRIEAVLQGEPQCFERTVPQRGREIHLQMNYVPDLADDGTVQGFYVMTLDVTERRRGEQLLADSERRMRLVTDHLPALVAHFDADERYTFVNAYAERTLGLDPATMLGRTLREVRGEAVYGEIAGHVARALRGEEVSFERLSLARGRPYHYRSDYIPDIDESGRVRGFYAMSFDLTESKTAQLKLADNERMLRAITDNLPVLISYIDRDERLRFANGTFRTWLGIDHLASVGQPLREVIGPARHDARRQYLARAMSGQRVEFEMEAESLGVRRHMQAVYIPDVRADGEVAGIYTLTTDVSAMKQVQRQLDELARVDALTGLPNRRQFEERLHEALARARRDQRPVALMFLDVDQFKAINDTMGHAGGDAVLREFGQRLRDTVRITDVAARLAGDEFVVLLEGVASRSEAERVAQKICDAIRREFQVGGTSMSVTTSLGVAFAVTPDVSAESMMASADEALYKAKRAGRNGWRVVPCVPRPHLAATAVG